MIIVILIVFIILFSHAKYIYGGNKNYLSRSQTQTINGFFIILIFVSHFYQYVNLTGPLNLSYTIFRGALSQYVVTTFLFYSGYGVMYSIKSKGGKYIDKIPLNRILKTLLIFDIAIVFYILLALIIGRDMTVPQILLSFIGWSSVGNSAWYIFAICCMYLATYIGFKICKKPEKIRTGLVITTILAFVYYFIMMRFKETRYYNSVLCYILGLWFFYFKPRIDNALEKKSTYFVTIITCAIFLVIFVLLREKNIIFNQLAYFLFVIFIVLFTMRVKISCRLFLWCGQNLLSLYVLQRLPMIALQQSEWMVSNYYVYFILCIIFTVPITLLFQHYIVKKVEIAFSKFKV